MKTNPRRGQAAFTLIELMAVVTIIVILAGIVIGGMSFVTEKQAKEKVKIQIALISKALEEFKLDNGRYPETDDTDDNSELIFDALYYEGASDLKKEKKIYIGELDPQNNKQGWTSGVASKETKIVDPWGKNFRYRTAVNANDAQNISCQNPDFDLWSSGKDGKTNADPSHKDCRDDIRNF